MSNNSVFLVQWCVAVLACAMGTPARAEEAKWDFRKGLEGWVAQHQCKLVHRDGAMQIRSEGGDPFLKVDVKAPAGWHKLTLVARFKGNRNAQIFWTTEENPNTSEGRSARFKMQSRGAEKWHAYVVYFHTKSPLTSIRLDPSTRPVLTELQQAKLEAERPPAESATDPAGIRVPKGFRVELLYSVPKLEQGSWVSMAVDGRAPNRLITCDQYGKLYRVTVGKQTKVEPIPVKIGGLQGMVWAFDALYGVVNGNFAEGPGLYRIEDSNRDGWLDAVRLLAKLPTTRIGVEHGPHGVVVSPDGKSLYVVAGNMTKLPQNLSKPTSHQFWEEDQVLPRLPASNGHATGLLAPGGWVCRVDKDGKQWDLIAAGFRNPYDIAFDKYGELFTYDADMEMDIGTPWYRPTRVCHVVKGGEFGWRFGTGKWPAYYPDTVPATVDVGLGSPTGVAFGYGTEFPTKYRDALYISDWTNGTMYAVFLKPEGASYGGTIEPFLTGVPLPLTDIVINPHDRAMYFTIGGRRTQSGLYRVTYDDAVTSEGEIEPKISDLVKLRRRLESLQTAPDPEQLPFIWENLAHEDRFIRYAARVALEHLPASQWSAKLSAEQDPHRILQATIAAIRRGEGKPQLLRNLKQLNLAKLKPQQQLGAIRALQLYVTRMKNGELEVENGFGKSLISLLTQPTSKPVRQELTRLLVRLELPEAVPFALQQMTAAKVQEERLFYAMVLRVATQGWKLERRRQFFTALNEFEVAAATGDFSGGGHMQVYVQMFRKDAAKGLFRQEQKQLQSVINAKLAEAFTTGSPTPRKFIKNWTVKELQGELEQAGGSRSYKNGQAMFRVASCIRCHRFNGTGGIFGPDLTSTSKRYSRAVLLREMMEPSKQISDQYQAHTVMTTKGKIFTGKILNEDKNSLVLATDPLKPSYLVEIPQDEIDEKRPAGVSLMPKGLLNTLTKEEILDLIAYIESGGDPKHPVYAK